MKTTLYLCTTLTVMLVIAGCATSTVDNPQSTVVQAELSQANFTVVKSGVKGEAMQTLLGMRLLGGQPFGIVLNGDKDLCTTAMDDLRAKAALEGKSRALANVTQELQYDPWIIIWHKVKMTVTADVIEYR